MIWEFWVIFLLFSILSVNLYLTAAVYLDAKKQRVNAMNVPPPVWGFVAFFFPLVGFFIYWLMHHSILVLRDKVRID